MAHGVLSLMVTVTYLRHTWRQSSPRAWRTETRSAWPARSCRSWWCRSSDPPSRTHTPGRPDTGSLYRTVQPALSPSRLHARRRQLYIIHALRCISPHVWKQKTKNNKRLRCRWQTRETQRLKYSVSHHMVIKLYFTRLGCRIQISTVGVINSCPTTIRSLWHSPAN